MCRLKAWCLWRHLCIVEPGNIGALGYVDLKRIRPSGREVVMLERPAQTACFDPNDGISQRVEVLGTVEGGDCDVKALMRSPRPASVSSTTYERKRRFLSDASNPARPRMKPSASWTWPADGTDGCSEWLTCSALVIPLLRPVHPGLRYCGRGPHSTKSMDGGIQRFQYGFGPRSLALWCRRLCTSAAMTSPLR